MPLRPLLWPGEHPGLLLSCFSAEPFPTPSLLCASPAGHRGKMGSRALGLALACCLLLAFACGPALGREPRGQKEQQEPEGTKEPPLGHTER